MSTMFMSNQILIRSFHVSCRCLVGYQEKVKITVPHKVEEKIRHKKKQILLQSTPKQRIKKNKPLLISCKKTEFNHYVGQRSSQYDPSKLASFTWKNRKSSNDHFTILPHRQNPSELTPDDCVTFKDLGLCEEILDRLGQLDLIKPTNVQKLAIPRILKGENLVCAAETGSGKTYAYLLPLVQQILQKNQSAGFKSSDVNAPRCIILAPAKELVQQIHKVATEITESFPIETHLLYGGGGTLTERRMPMDLLVATPGVIKSMFKRRVIKRSRLLHIVLDEADSLLDDSFREDLHPILIDLQARVSLDSEIGLQTLLVSATVPRDLTGTLGTMLPLEDFQEVRTNHLHHVMPHVEQKFIRISSQNKLHETVEIVKRIQQQPNSRLLIFCNKSDTCYFVSKSLEDVGIQNQLFTGFSSHHGRGGEGFKLFQDGTCDVLVCSDIGSRGLDTTMATHILNYDFPAFISDYIHRGGRVGRIGSRPGTGTIISFITYKWDVDLVWNIEMSVRNMKGLDNVNANIKRKLQRRHLPKGKQSALFD